MNINLKKINYDLIIKLIVFTNFYFSLFMGFKFNFDPFLFIISCILIFIKKKIINLI